MIAASTEAFFKSPPFGRASLDSAYTIPKSAPIEVPNMALAKTCPSFCQILYDSYSVQNSGVSSA